MRFWIISHRLIGKLLCFQKYYNYVRNNKKKNSRSGKTKWLSSEKRNEFIKIRNENPPKMVHAHRGSSLFENNVQVPPKHHITDTKRALTFRHTSWALLSIYWLIKELQFSCHPLVFMVITKSFAFKRGESEVPDHFLPSLKGLPLGTI